MKNRLKWLLLTLLVFTVPLVASGQKLKADEVLAKHLASIGPPEKRAAIKTLIAVGEVRVEFITQKNHPATGRIVIASEGNKIFLGMNLNAADYPQETIIHNGEKTAVALVRAGSRSVLGNFIQTNTYLVSQGVLGGVLTSAWALLDRGDKGLKISSSGTKKIDGKEVYALRVSPKSGGDVEITMFFDTQTFHHVRTEYTRTSSSSIGQTIDESARQSESRIKMIEDFSNFKEVHGMTYPSRYKILYTISGARGTTEVEWSADLNEFAINQALDPATFGAAPKTR